MKILVTGSNGLLGQKLVYALRHDNSEELVATAKEVRSVRIVFIDLAKTEHVCIEGSNCGTQPRESRLPFQR